MNALKLFLTWGLLLAATHVLGVNITVDPIEIEAGKTAQLVINLNNTEDNLTAYQMSLYLPEGVTVQKKSNGKYAYTANSNRHDGEFTFSMKDAADGSVLITCFSADKDVLTGNSGELIRLPLEVASTVTTSLQASLKNMEFTDVSTNAFRPENVTFDLTLKSDIPTGSVSVSVSDLTLTAGGTTDLVIDMTTDISNLTAYQMSLYLPEGVTVQKKSNGKYSYTANSDRHDGEFTFSVKDAADGSVLITCFSADKDVLTGNSGELIRLPLEVASTVTTSLQASLKGIEFTDVNRNAFRPENVTFNMTLEPVAPTGSVSVSVSDLTLTAGGTTDLVIDMTTDVANLTAYQMSLYLPDGVTVQKKSNGKYAYTANSNRHDGEFTFSVKDAADGSVLITCFSADKDVLTGTSGELIRLPLEVATTAANTVQASLKSIEFTDVNRNAFRPENVTFNMTIESVAPTGSVSVSVPNLTVTAGGTTDLVIDMTTDISNLTAYQMSLYLPEGVTVQKKSNGKYAYTVNSDRHDGEFTFSVKDAADGSVLITCFSADKDVLTGTSGELFRLPLEVASTVTTSLQASLKGIEFTDVNRNAFRPENVTFNMTLEPVAPTGSVSVSVSDLTLTAGGTTDLVIDMTTGVANLTAYQMSLYLPEGVTVQKKSNGKYAYTANSDRHDGEFTFSVKDAADGSVLITCFSADKDVLTGTSGELIRLPLEVASTVTTSLQASLKSIEFTDVNRNAFRPENVTFNMTLEPVAPTGSVSVSVSDLTLTAGGTTDLVIDMTTDVANLTAYQMSLCLPEGVTVQKKSNGKYAYTVNSDRHDGEFTFSMKDAADGRVLITCFSADNDVLTGTSGELIRLSLEVATTAANTLQASLKGIEFADVNANAFHPEDVTFNIVVTVPVQPVTITADNLTMVYGDEIPTLTYKSEGAELNGTPKISTTATKTSPVGTYPIIIEKGTVTNEQVTYVNGTLTITKAPLTISAGTYTKKQGEPMPEFTLSYEGFKNNETKDVLTVQPTVSCAATEASEPGEYPVTVSGAEAQNYEISYVGGKLIVAQADPVVIKANSYTREYGDENPVFEFTTEGAALEGLPEITCEATATSAVGTYDIVVKQGTVKNYNVTYVAGTLTITKAPLTISAGTYTKKQGEPMPEFTLSYEGFKNDETKDVLTKQPIVSCAATEASEPGEYPVTVSGAEAQNYDISHVSGKLIVAQADAVVIKANSYTRIYGDENPVFEFTTEGAALEGQPEITCEATATSAVGTYDIVVKQGTVKNYNVTYVAGTLTITKAPLTISAGTYTKKQGEPMPEFTLSYEGFKNNETKDVLTKQPTVSCAATEDSEPGRYPVTVSGAEAQNYKIEYVDGMLTVDTPTGINSVINGGRLFDVYTTTGAKVRCQTNTLAGLPKGIYIVDGKKIIIK